MQVSCRSEQTCRTSCSSTGRMLRHGGAPIWTALTVKTGEITGISIPTAKVGPGPIRTLNGITVPPYVFIGAICIAPRAIHPVFGVAQTVVKREFPDGNTGLDRSRVSVQNRIHGRSMAQKKLTRAPLHMIIDHRSSCSVFRTGNSQTGNGH